MTDSKPLNVVCSLPDDKEALKSLCGRSPNMDAMNECHACLEEANLEEGETHRMCVAKLMNADPATWFAAMIQKKAVNLQCATDPSIPFC